MRNKKDEKSWAAIGSKIKELRLERGLSQEELGKLVGYKAPRQAISKVERGISGMETTKLKRLADVLGVDVNVFFDLAKDTTPDYELVFEFVNKLSKMEPEERKQIEAIIEIVLYGGDRHGRA